MVWENTGNPLKKYFRQQVNEGFLLTEGMFQYGGGESGLDSIYLPTLGILRVHDTHPFVVSDTGEKITVRPAGDKRLIGPISRDENPKVYDSVVFALFPDYCEQDFSGSGDTKVLARYKSGMVALNEGWSPGVSLVCHLRGALVDEQGMRVFSTVSSSQVPTQFGMWLGRRESVYGYRDGRLVTKNFGDIAIADDIVRDAVEKAGRLLEDRFDTRLLPHDKG